MTLCITCDEHFDKKYNCQKYCSDSCRWASPRHAARRKRDRRNLRDKQLFMIRVMKVLLGCELCGYRGHFSALQFDHIEPEDKRLSMGQAHSWGVNSTIKEMAKCRILCANCHSIHSYNQWMLKRAFEEQRLQTGT